MKGRYPQKLLDAWDVFDQQKQSENDPPGDFDENQLFIVFIFGDGGCDLENVKVCRWMPVLECLRWSGLPGISSSVEGGGNRGLLGRDR